MTSGRRISRTTDPHQDKARDGVGRCTTEQADIPPNLRVFLMEVGEAVKEHLAKKRSEARTMDTTPGGDGAEHESSRVLSVIDEDQVDGYSLDAQRRAFGEFCRQKGWEVAETYSEEGRSAWIESIGKRPAFRRMLEDAETRKFDVVVTHTLDRFSRNLRVMQDAFHIFAQNDVTYVSITQEIEYSKPEGKLFMTMLGAFAQYFSDALSGHTKKGMKERAQQGLFNGEPPFGYQRCDPECIGLDQGHTGCHVVSEKPAKVVEVFERYASGTESMSTLADWLNRQGCRTNGRRRAEVLGELIEVDGRLFTHWSVRDILKNPFYVGKVRHKDEIFEGRHQGIVPQKLFDAVQDRMTKNRSRRSVSVSYKSDNPHLLTGLLRCHECGTTLWSQHQGRKAGTYYSRQTKGRIRAAPIGASLSQAGPSMNRSICSSVNSDSGKIGSNG